MSNDKLMEISNEERRRYRIVGGAFLATVAGISAIFGFSRTLMASKRQDQKLFDKTSIENIRSIDAATSLALRALAWGTFYAVLGTGAFCYGVWKLSGAKNMQEFREKMGKGLPRLTKEGPPTSRTEFEGLNDLMQYLATWKTK